MSSWRPQTNLAFSSRSKISAFREKLEERWADMQNRRNMSTMEGSITGKCHLFSLPPELIGLVIDRMGDYKDLRNRSSREKTCGTGCLPMDTVRRQRDFLSFARAHRSIPGLIRSYGHPKTSGHIIVYDFAEFRTSIQSALKASYRSGIRPGELRSLSWMTHMWVVSDHVNSNAGHLFRVLTTKEDFTDKMQRTLEEMKRSLHLSTSDTTEPTPVMGNLQSIAFIHDIHVHTSTTQFARLDREISRYEKDRKRKNQWTPDISQQMQRFSIGNDAGYCVRKDQHSNQLPWESDRGSRLTHHMEHIYEADLDFKNKTGPLTWYVELTTGHFHDEEDAHSRLAFFESVADAFPVTDGPESLSIYLPHLMDFPTDAEQKGFLEFSQARMLKILARKGAATITSAGEPRIKLDCIHDAPECQDCLGMNQRFTQCDKVRVD